MLSCKEAIRLASEALDRPLSLRSRAGLRLHLLMCSACRAVARQIKALDFLIGRRFAGGAESPEDSPTPDPTAPDRVRRTIHSALDQRR